jgi:outer membrane protein W
MALSFSNSQTLKFLQIPIEIEFGMQRNKFRYFFRTGFSYSYLISEKSEFVTAGFAPVRKENVSLLYRNSLTTSFAVGVEYIFNQNWALLLSPNFTYYLTSLNRNLAFKTMPFWVGLETSVKYYIK